jgi:hypothetical protein
MRKIIAATGVGIVLIAAPVVVTGAASANPGQNCTSQWNTMYNVPIGVRATCYNPDGSYRVCDIYWDRRQWTGNVLGLSSSSPDGGAAHLQSAGAGNAASAAARAVTA